MVLPSTDACLRWAHRHASGERRVIATQRHVACATAPSSYLDECRRRIAQGAAPPSALLFSDQFVEAPHAVLLVEHDRRRYYLSAIEVVAHTCHGIDVHVWTGAEPLSFVASGEPRVALRLLAAQSTYLDACERLGERWLARAEQGLRLEPTRLRATVHRTRCYESYLLQAHADSGMDAATREVLAKLRALRRQAVAAARALPC